jgi:hypothetical protein
MEAFVTTADNASLVLKSDSDRPFELVEGWGEHKVSLSPKMHSDFQRRTVYLWRQH